MTTSHKHHDPSAAQGAKNEAVVSCRRYRFVGWISCMDWTWDGSFIANSFTMTWRTSGSSLVRYFSFFFHFFAINGKCTNQLLIFFCFFCRYLRFSMSIVLSYEIEYLNMDSEFIYGFWMDQLCFMDDYRWMDDMFTHYSSMDGSFMGFNCYFVTAARLPRVKSPRQWESPSVTESNPRLVRFQSWSHREMARWRQHGLASGKHTENYGKIHHFY